MAYEECTVVGRNAVLEAYRSGKTIDKLFILDGCQDGPVRSILREARKRDTLIPSFPVNSLLCQIPEQASNGLSPYCPMFFF